MKSDALEVVRSQVPAKVFAFAQALAADPEMRPAVAAKAVDVLSPTEFMRDPRTHKVLAVIMAADTEAMANTRRAGIQMLAALVGYDPADFFDKYGEIRKIHDIPPEARAAIAGFEKRADGSIKVRFVDRVAALRLLLAHFGDLPGDGATINAAPGATVILRGRGPL